jgi:hypothetical protein
VIICILPIEILFGQNFKWIFEDPYRDDLLYVHPLINYDYHPLWQNEWERNLLSNNGLRINVGSVTTYDLLGEGKLFINEDLSNGWGFLGYGNWNATRHLNGEEKYLFLGLQRHIYKPISIFLTFHPAYDKEFIDAHLGITLSNKKQDQFIRIGLLFEDFLYDEKNSLDGISEQYPYGLQWVLGFGNKKWWIYSDGRLSNGFERFYPDKELSSFLDYHQQQINRFTAKLYHSFSQKWLMEIKFSYYQFEEIKLFSEKNYDYTYDNKISDVSFQMLFSLNKNHRFRALTHFLQQRASSSGFSEHSYKRSDIMPALFYEFLISRHIIELGVMGSRYDWQYQGNVENPDYSENKFVEKVKLGWSYKFNEKAQFQFSVSHVFSVFGFGGGNFQYMMFF